MLHIVQSTTGLPHLIFHPTPTAPTFLPKSGTLSATPVVVKLGPTSDSPGGLAGPHPQSRNRCWDRAR